MSLFVGSIARSVNLKQLTEIFEAHGECSVKHKGSYAFVDFNNKDNAKKALDEENGKENGGLRL